MDPQVNVIGDKRASRTCVPVPGCLFGRSLQLCRHMEKVKTKEDSPLQKKTYKTEAVPDDARFLHWEDTGAWRIHSHSVRCTKTKK